MSLSEIRTEVAQVRANQYMIAATTAMVIYDTILNLPQEMELIWKANRSWVKYFYLFNRYSVPTALVIHAVVMGGFWPGLNDDMCGTYERIFYPFTSLEGYVISDTLVLVRVWALYKGVKGIRLILVLIWLINAVPAIVIISVAALVASPGQSAAITLGYDPTFNICTVSGRPSYMWCVWIGMLFFQTAVCGMILYKTYGHRRSLGSQNTMAIFLRDGLFFYTIILGAEILNLILFLTLPVDLYMIAFLPDWSLSALLISRIFLNLRHATTYHEWTQATTLADSAELEAQIGHARQRQEKRFRSRMGPSETVIIGEIDSVELGDVTPLASDGIESESDVR